MLKKLFAVLAMLVLATTSVMAGEFTLPDYTKAPYVKRFEGSDAPTRRHPDAAHLTMYTARTTDIIVYSDDDGQPRYAEWWTVDHERRPLTYIFRGGAWVLVGPKYDPGDTRGKNFVVHLIPAQVGLTPLNKKERLGTDFGVGIHFTACRVGIVRACGLGVMMGNTFPNEARTIHNPLDPLPPIVLDDPEFTLLVTSPVAIRLKGWGEGYSHRSCELHFNVIPYYDVAHQRFTIGYGLSMAF